MMHYLVQVIIILLSNGKVSTSTNYICLLSQEPPVWNTASHKLFHQSRRQAIRAMIVLAFSNNARADCLLRKLPRDILWFVCQLITSAALTETYKRQKL